MKVARLIEAIAGTPEESGWGESFLCRLGELLARELQAAGWAFYGPSGEDPLVSGGISAHGPAASGSLSIPCHADPPCEGRFVLLFDETREPGPAPDEIRTLATAIGSAARLQRLRLQYRNCSRTLDLFSSLSRDCTGILDLSRFTGTLARTLRDHLGAVAGIIDLRRDPLADSSHPSPFTFPEHLAPFFRQIALGERQGSEAELVMNRPPGSSPLSLLELPLIFKGEDLGRIVLWIPPDGWPLSSSGGRMLGELAEEVSIRVMNLLLHRRGEALLRERQKRLQEIWILQETNKALRGTLKLNRILKMILAGATVKSGLGFNRAALFLLNERTGILQGMLAVGPDSAEDADRIWNSLSKHENLGLSRQIEIFAETQPSNSRLDRMVKGIRIPLEDGRGILAHSVRTRSPALVPSGESFPPPEKELVEGLGMISFAVTPIMSREQVFGVMVVDNLYDGKPVTPEDLRLLAMFADQAGLAIANAKAHRAHQRAAEELRLARDQLVQNERLAVLGEVASNIAHEIRNPLVTIGGFARRLEKKLDPSDLNRRYASVIAGEAMRLEHFLEEVLLFGQDRKPNLLPVSLNDVVSGAIGLFEGSFAEAGITVRNDLAQELPPVHGDPGQLRQIFVNLFANAVEAMAGGGILEVITGLDAGPPPTLFASVSDTGGGVSPEVLGDIFSPFFTTKSSGHGLGLALTQRIVNAHAGRINVKNRPGTGLTFLISLPSFPESGRSARPSVTSERKGGRSS